MNCGHEHDDRGRDFLERIIHDAGEFGEENVEQVDREWAEFEKFMRWVCVLWKTEDKV